MNIRLLSSARKHLVALSLIISSIFCQAQPVIGLQTIVNGSLAAPIEIVAPSDGTGRLFIVQQRGKIRIWNGGTSLLAEDFLDISALLSTGDEQGLLSMAFHPNFSTNKLFYVYYTNTSGQITVAAYKVSDGDPNKANTSPEPGSPLMVISKLFSNHNGGHLQFRTESGTNYLYFGTGDGGSSNDPNNNAQNMGSMLGKMIRINVDAPSIVPEIWAIGLRNPFRWSFDRANGDMWIGDVGQGLKEEVDFLPNGVSGINYGWPCFEGTIKNVSAMPACDPADDLLPIFQYDNPPSSSSAVTGGYVYRGSEYPALNGYYISADFYSGQIWLLRSPNAGSFAVLPQSAVQTFISAFGEAEDGTLYAVSMSSGSLYKIIVTGVLPVDLLDFTGRELSGHNELKWTTTTESNVKKFIIEYSLNSMDFQVAAEKAASGNSNGAVYSYDHAITGNGKVFYRLKIVDNDGRSRYSPIITLGSQRSKEIKIYPTVITNNTVQVISGYAIDNAAIYTTEGKLISSQKLNGTGGYFIITLSPMQKGMYFLKLMGKDVQKTEKIFIN